MRVTGTVRVPGDKSISHRALILAALADGPSRVRGLLDSADVRSTAGVLRALGLDVPEVAAAEIVVRGLGPRALRAPAVELDCGNSGTTARLVAGLVAACPFAARFTGDASLSRRPMGRVARPLAAMGARITASPAGTLPMEVHGGSLRAIEWESEAASAQVKSALLIAGAAAGVAVTVREPARSRDHTERMLRAMGAPVETDGATVRLAPGAPLAAVDRTVPGDPSSAAFFVALATLAQHGELLLPDVGVNPTRTGFLAVLQRMGAELASEEQRHEGGEPVAALRVSAGRTLRGADVAAAEVPSMIDELPLLACVAARAEGETTITGARELRVKESDRIAAVVAGLRAIGVEADESADGLRVVGAPRRPLRGRVATHGDHRLAMAFGVLAALPGSEVAIDDPDCVSVSYPAFWRDLARVTS
ncbi:MAG: 3-phosphoshikimate 1-carboxyvinyltransferase [Gemmatimonadaceae bacterium]